MIVTLIGYRGSGKTTIARPLATALGCGWIDADDELERRAGRTIREIFATDGEGEFRRLEREVLTDLLQQPPLVIAAGGGAILNDQTRRDFRHAGPVIWLQASIDELMQRISGDATTAERRPNLTNAGGRAEVATLLEQREPLYRDAATITVHTDGRPTADIVAEILSKLPTDRPGESAP